MEEASLFTGSTGSAGETKARITFATITEVSSHTKSHESSAVESTADYTITATT